MALAGNEQRYLLVFRNAAKARQFVASQDLVGAEPRMVVRGNRDELVRIARAAAWTPPPPPTGLPYRLIGDDLGYRPTGKVRVEILAAPADLAKLSPLTESDIETTGTIALSKYEKLMLVSPRATLTGYPWLDSLVHEYTHYVIAHASRDTVPVWLHEGLARFEQTRWRSDAGGGLTAIEQQLLATAIKTRRLIDLDAMHPSMAKLPSAEAAALAYAEVLTLVAWLHGKVGYAGLRQALALQAGGKSARRALAEVTDTTWVKFEKDWRAHLRTLDLSGGRASAINRAALVASPDSE